MTTHALWDAVVDWLVRTSWQTAVLVALIQRLLGPRRLPPRWAYALWMLVVVRLLMPAVPQSPWSMFNLRLLSWTRGVEHSRSSGEHRVAEATRPRVEASPLPESTHVTVGIIDGPQRHVTSSVLVTSDNAEPASVALISSTAFDPKSFVAVVWLAGLAVAIARVLTGVLILRRRIGDGDGADAETLALVCRCGREIGFSKPSLPRLLVTDAVRGPALFGFFRPVLLVPPHLLTSLSREELRFVFLHELTHLRRRDPLANMLLVLASAVHWFNPLVWFALARCRAERELACDERVMAHVDRDPSTRAAPADAYGQAVLRVAESLRASARRVPVAAVGMIHTRSQLRRRIAMIATYTPPAKSRHSLRFPRAALPVVFMLLAASCALTDGATKPTSKPSSAASDAAARVHEKSGTTTPVNGDTGASKDPDVAIVDTMERTMPEVSFDGAAFGDVIDFLRDESGINLTVDWHALEAAGIAKDTPITARVRNVKFTKALQIILDQAGGNTVKLGYSVGGNVMNVTTMDELSKKTLTRVYDVRDLLIEIPNYTTMPNFDLGSAHTKPSVAPAQPADDQAKGRPARVAELVKIVKETVMPGSWIDNGGGQVGQVGSIAQLDGQLIVTQTPDAQLQIATLLEKLRETRGVQVTVETRFISFDPANLDEPLRRRLTATFDRKARSQPAYLSDDDVRAIIRAGQAQKDSTIVTAPRITLFSGQRAYVMVGTQQAYVSGLNAVKAANGDTRWEPTTSSTETGVLLDVEATASADRKFATLTLRPKLSHLDSISDEPFNGPPDAPKGMSVQVPHISMQSLQTTVTVPDGQTIVLGGVGPDVDRGADIPTTRPAAYAFVLVKPTLIVQRADHPEGHELKNWPHPSPKD